MIWVLVGSQARKNSDQATDPLDSIKLMIRADRPITLPEDLTLSTMRDRAFGFRFEEGEELASSNTSPGWLSKLNVALAAPTI